MNTMGGNGLIERDRCARCGRSEGIEPFGYHAYREVTTHGELPKTLKEVGKIFQGRSVYHDLVQLSAMICSRCVWKARLLRGVVCAVVAAVLAAAAVPLWHERARYMERFDQARQEMEQYDPSQHPDRHNPDLEHIDDTRLNERIFVAEQGRLQRAKDEALLYALPLGWASVGCVVLAAAVVAWGLWSLRWERLGQIVAAAAMGPSCRKQGLKHVRPGHLTGGRAV